MGSSHSWGMPLKSSVSPKGMLSRRGFPTVKRRSRRQTEFGGFLPKNIFHCRATLLLLLHEFSEIFRNYKMFVNANVRFSARVYTSLRRPLVVSVILEVLYFLPSVPNIVIGFRAWDFGRRFYGRADLHCSWFYRFWSLKFASPSKCNSLFLRLSIKLCKDLEVSKSIKLRNGCAHKSRFHVGIKRQSMASSRRLRNSWNKTSVR